MNFRNPFSRSEATPGPSNTDDWSSLSAAETEFRTTFSEAKARVADADFPWYPYDTLANFSLIDAVLTGENRSIQFLTGKQPILDIGCADGATSFLLASLGHRVDAVDYPSTNFNGMRGIRLLRDFFKTSVEIHAVDLDSQFVLPRQQYGLTLFLGILYHLKNPFYSLQQLAISSRYCLLSTRVAKFDSTKTISMEHLPVAYLVSPFETNNDPTNYWIFSRAGLTRLFERTGWTVCDSKHFGNTTNSDPASQEGDERAFCLLRSLAFPK